MIISIQHTNQSVQGLLGGSAVGAAENLTFALLNSSMSQMSYTCGEWASRLGGLWRSPGPFAASQMQGYVPPCLFRELLGNCKSEAKHGENSLWENTVFWSEQAMSRIGKATIIFWPDSIQIFLVFYLKYCAAKKEIGDRPTEEGTFSQEGLHENRLKQNLILFPAVQAKGKEE